MEALPGWPRGHPVGSERDRRAPVTRVGLTLANIVPGYRFRPRVPFRCGLSFGLIHPSPSPFTGGHPDRVRAARGRWRTPVNAMQHCWKACWGQPLAGSNPASSATSDQAIHQPTSCVRAALARLRSLIRSLLHSTHISIKRPKGVGARFWVPRPCSRPLDVPVLDDLLGAGAQQAVAGEREGVCLAFITRRRAGSRQPAGRAAVEFESRHGSCRIKPHSCERAAWQAVEAFGPRVAGPAGGWQIP